MAYSIQIGAATIFCEASGEPTEVKLGVAWVLVNRAVDGRWGRTISEVCLDRKQFSEWNDDSGNNANLKRMARAGDADAVLMECEEALRTALHSGNETDPTQGATHYHDTSIAPPDWTEGAVRTVQLGKLVFYKGVK